jgi:hypothetical protein
VFDLDTVTRHRWNTEFHWEEHAGPFRCLTAPEAMQFDDLGFVVVDDVIPASDLERVLAEIDRFEAELKGRSPTPSPLCL